ncbi:hypothetical protein F8M41_013281 [Gigaspora margarita]|uniref:Uncharacterized protein n=1 Tax=Gigaspora margarita TaxID=4874 RepID=A0A8H3WYI4_GIGMA|nr:hypothetical protein F8M41_013281 [Gigaspora margarita]
MFDFDASKNSNEQNVHSQASTSSVNASKGKGGSQFGASKSSQGLVNFLKTQKAVLVANKVEVHSMQAKAPLNRMDLFKSLQAMLTPQKVKVEANSLQAKALLKTNNILKVLQAVVMPNKVRNMNILLKKS